MATPSDEPGRRTRAVPIALGLLALTAVGLILSDRPTAPREELPVDPALFARARVVLRVRLVGVAEGSKYHWAPVEIVSVLKNESQHHFSDRLEIAYLGWEPGVPSGLSTVYLERYNKTDHPNLWKLLDGSASLGVSNSVPNAAVDRPAAEPRVQSGSEPGSESMDPPVGQIIQQESGRYELLMVDFPAVDYLEEHGWQGGGHSWGAIAEVLLKLKADQSTREAISFDCEGDTFVATSDSQAPLVALSKWIKETEGDERLLKEAIAQAEADGTME